MIKIILKIIISVIGTVIVFALMLLSPASKANENLAEEITSVESLSYNLVKQFNEYDGADELVLNIEQDIIQALLFDVLTGEKMEIFKVKEDGIYLVQQESAKLQNLVVNFYDDEVNFKVIAGYGDSLAKTKIEINFGFKDTDDHYEIELLKIRVGNIPIPIIEKAIVFATDMLENYPFVKSSAKGLVLVKDEISDFLYDLPGGIGYVGTIYDLVRSNKLIKVGFIKENNEIILAIKKLLNDTSVSIPKYLQDLVVSIEGDEVIFDEAATIKKIVQREIQNYYFDTLLDSDAVFKVSQEAVNKLTYIRSNAYIEDRQIVTIEGEDFSVGYEGLFFEIGDNNIVVKRIMYLGKLVTQIEITYSVTTVGDDLILKFESGTIGKDEGELAEEYIDIDEEQIKSLVNSMVDELTYASEEITTIEIKASSLYNLFDGSIVDGSFQIGKLEFEEGSIIVNKPDDSKMLEGLETGNEEFMKNIKGELTEVNGLTEDFKLILSEASEAFIRNDIDKLEKVKILRNYLSKEDIEESNKEAMTQIFTNILGEKYTNIFK